MNRQRTVFLVAMVAAIVVSATACYPLVNVLRGNPAGWFTMDNIDGYGGDLDARAEEHGGELVVFTGHPSYVMAADDARLLFDMPRNHYYAATFNDTRYGDRWYQNLTQAFQTGRADIAIAGPMTEAILKQNTTAASAFANNYCRVKDVDAQQLYAQTHSTLYVYEPDCPASRRPTIENMSHEN